MICCNWTIKLAFPIWSYDCLYFQICVSLHMCLVTVYYVLEHWNYPLKNILGELGCHIANLLRQTGSLQIQFHSFIMATTRYIFLFHDNLLLRFNLTTNVSAITYSLHCTKQRPCKFILIFRHTIVRQCYGNLNF